MASPGRLRRVPAWLPLLLIPVAGFGAQARADAARDIMVKNEEIRRIQDITSDAQLTTGGGGKPDRMKKFTWWRKLRPDGVFFNTLTRFHEPAEVRGEGILFLEHGSDSTDVMIFLPNFKKTRRVEKQAQSGSFMGSEFSYSDISTPHVDDYKYKLLKEEPCPDGTPCAVIEAVPVSESIREKTGYSRTVNWVRKDNSMFAKAEDYDLEGALLKNVEFGEIKEVDAAKHKWMAHRIRVENVKTRRFTVLQFAATKVNAGISDAVFTQQSLERVQ